MTKKIICAWCGKEKTIILFGNWSGWKRREKKKTVYFCSYECLSKYDEVHPHKKRMVERCRS